MKWKLSVASAGDDLGAMATQLPEGTAGPARLPQEVIDFESKDKGRLLTDDSKKHEKPQSSAWKPRKAPYPTKDVAKIPDNFPSTGYELTFQASSIRPWVLQHPDYQFAFQMLPDEYILYQDEKGEDVIIGNKLGPIYCADLLRLEASGFRVRKAEALAREGRRAVHVNGNH